MYGIQLRQTCLKEAERVWGKSRYICNRGFNVKEAGAKCIHRYYQEDAGKFCIRAHGYKELLACLKKMTVVDEKVPCASWCTVATSKLGREDER